MAHTLYKMQVSKSWTPTQAIIIDSHLKVNNSRGQNLRRAKAYYTYEFDGKEYENDRVTFFDEGTDNVGSSALISRKLSVAKRVLIYVNPKNPEESTIVTGLTNSILFPLWFLGVVWFVIFCWYQMVYKEPLSLKKMGLGVLMLWCYGMVQFYTGLLAINMNKKITILEKRIIKEIKPPTDMVIKDVQRGIDENLFVEYVGTKEIYDIRVSRNESLFGNKKPPYYVDIQFSYDKNGKKEIFKGAILYINRKTGWEADFQ